MQRIASLLSLLAFVPLAAAPARADWKTDTLSAARQGLAAVTVGDLALFAGGRSGSTGPSAVVDVYDDATGTWSTTALSVARGGDFAATAVGQYALFAGGAVNPTTSTDVVDVFDAQTMTWSSATLSQARFGLTATTLGDKAFFAGGATGGPNNFIAVSDVVDVYDASIGLPSDPSAWSTATLSEARGGIAAASVGGQAVFAGGLTATAASARVDIYDASIGLPSDPAAWSTATLSDARLLGPAASATAGTRAYFGGGQTVPVPPVMSAVVDVYDAETGLWSVDTLSAPRGLVAATALGNTVLFAGGDLGGFVPSDTVDLLNAGTGFWGPTAKLSQARMGIGATTVGGKALFAGGFAGPGAGASAVIDVYEPVGLNYCAALANSTGCAASISADGSPSLAANDLELSAACVPDQPFIFFHAPSQMQDPFGDGFLCAGGGAIRILPPGMASGGVAERTVDLPSAGITSPGARNFQCWFRDPAAGAAGFSTSDGLEITFVP